jgi:hypothetical protein
MGGSTLTQSDSTVQGQGSSFLKNGGGYISMKTIIPIIEFLNNKINELHNLVIKIYSMTSCCHFAVLIIYIKQI